MRSQQSVSRMRTDQGYIRIGREKHFLGNQGQPHFFHGSQLLYFSCCWLGLFSQITSASGRSFQGILLFDRVLLFYKMAAEMSVWDVCSGLLLLGIAEGCHWSPDSRPLQSSLQPTSVTWVVKRSRRSTAWLQIRQRWQMSGSLFSRVQVETKSLGVNKRCGCPMRAQSKVPQGTSAEKVRAWNMGCQGTHLCRRGGVH